MKSSKAAERLSVPRADPDSRFISYEQHGDFMSPTINPGDLVEIDTAVKAIPRDGVNSTDRVFLIDIDGYPCLRRIQYSFKKGRFLVSCDKLGDHLEYREKDIKIVGLATRAANIRDL